MPPVLNPNPLSWVTAQWAVVDMIVMSEGKDYDFV